MSRTYRRKNVPDWLAYKHYYSIWRIDNKTGERSSACEHVIDEKDKPKSIAHLHSDMFDWNGRYLKSIRQETESEHRQHSKTELHKFTRTDDYEPMIDRKRKLPWW